MTRATLVLCIAALISCNTSSTSPKPATTKTYTGAVAGASASGSFRAVFSTGTSSASALGSNVDRDQNGSGATVTITLLNGQTLTLSGTDNGSSFTVSDGAGDSCTGTFANILNAQCKQAGSGLMFGLVGALALENATGGLTTYCGLEHIPGGVAPDASLLIGIAGTQSIVARISVSDNTPTFFAGSVSGSSFRDTSVTPHYPNVETGTFTTTSAHGSDSSSGATVDLGDWTAAAPCTLTHASLTPTHASFTATANGSAPAAQLALVSPTTLGPMTVVVPGAATWLTATTVYDTLKLSVSTAQPPGSYQAIVNLYPQFAANTPLVDTISYTVQPASAAGSAALWLGNSDGQLLEYTNLSASFGAPTISTGSGYGTGAGYLASDKNGNLWITSGYRQTVAEIPPSGFATGTASVNFKLNIPPQGNPPRPTGIAFDANGTLWVADSANSGWFYGYTTSDLAQASPSPSHIYDLTGVSGTSSPLPAMKLAGLTFDAQGNLWIADAENSYVFKIQPSQLNGSNPTLSAYGLMIAGGASNNRPHTLAFDSHGNLWVSCLTGGTLFVYAPTVLATVQGLSSPLASYNVNITGVADSITSIAFDSTGNLWMVEGAYSNAGSGLAMVPAASLLTGAANVSPTITFDENQPGPQRPTSITFVPPPKGIPIYQRAKRR